MQTTTITIDDLQVPLQPLLRGPRRGVDHHLHDHIARRLRLPRERIASYRIDRRSLDARRKPQLHFLYRVDVEVTGTPAVAEDRGVHVHSDAPNQEEGLYQLDLDTERPRDALIVGTGPAGIMAAYLLALHGTRVHIIDRGRDVERRGHDVERLHSARQLDPDSNYLFGEGGAGTYSDGKLYTRVKDRRMRFLLEAWVAARAPRNILYVHHPHIGSDILPHMARRLRQQIETWAAASAGTAKSSTSSCATVAAPGSSWPRANASRPPPP